MRSALLDRCPLLLIVTLLHAACTTWAASLARPRHPNHQHRALRGSGAFEVAARRLISRHASLMQQDIANGTMQWHMEHDDSLGCFFVQVVRGQTWVSLDGPGQPQPWWVVLRMEVVLDILDEYLGGMHRHDAPSRQDFSFYLCTTDYSTTAHAGHSRLALSTAICTDSHSLPAYQHLPAINRDPDWANWQAYADGLQQRHDVRASWASRQAKAVFRGRPTGHAWACNNAACTAPHNFINIGPHNWQQYGRYHLLYLRSQRPDLLNVAFPPDVYPHHKEWNYTFNTSAYPMDEPAHVPLGDQVATFKYALYVEGWCGWADRLKLLLLHGFLVLLQDTPCSEYYKHLFQPWVHYVPVDSRMTNLTRAIEWAQTHDEEAKAIAVRGQRHAAYVFSRHNVLRYMFAVFDQVRRLNALVADARPTEPVAHAVRFNRSLMLTAVPKEMRGGEGYLQLDQGFGWWVATGQSPG